MTVQAHTIEAFVKLGLTFSDFVKNPEHPENQDLEQVLLQAERKNAWFTQKQLRQALQEWSELLTQDALEHWVKPYGFMEVQTPKTIAIIMAGNIPLVGFHDFLSVLLSGNTVFAKLSSNDNVLLPYVANLLVRFYPELKNHIAFTEERLTGFDAVIATGSNNTSRYFEHYFGKYPNIIRKNRNSVAVLTGNESSEDLISLGEDVFRYFGLGCRNVSKIFVPEGYDFDLLFKAMFKYQDIIHHHKYANNYDYNKAVYLMSDIALLDNGFLLLKEDASNASPISVLFYEYYSQKENLEQLLTENKDALQCVVTHLKIPQAISFGQTQKPALSDYADDVDTLAFLKAL
ncbi:MAG: acyl-CoA reductase [Bacteroidota bacterium]